MYSAVVNWLDGLSAQDVGCIAVQRQLTALLQTQLQLLLGVRVSEVDSTTKYLFRLFLLYGEASGLPKMQELILQVLGYEQKQAVVRMFNTDERDAVVAVLSILVHMAIMDTRENRPMYMLNALVLAYRVNHPLSVLHQEHLVAQFEGAVIPCDLPPVPRRVLRWIVDDLSSPLDWRTG